MTSTPSLRVELPAPHEGQREFEASVRRFNILCCGRRWGKDVELQRRIVRQALHTRKPVAWFAPTYKMLLENWRDLRHILQPVTARPSEAEHRIDLITGNPLEMWSLDNPDSPRGRKYAYVAINEAAMVKDLLSTWSMVIRPTLADYQGAADFGSTPRGLNGFFELWRQAEDNPEWSRKHFTTYDNPFMKPDEVEAMKASLPSRVFQQEILAEFIEDGGYFQNIDNAAVVAKPDKPEDHHGHYTVMGVDWALSNDFTVLTVGCRDCNRVVDWQRFNQIDFTYQRERVMDMAKRWNARLFPERNSIGEPNIEVLAQSGLKIMRGPDNGLGFLTTATSKPALIQRLAAGLEHDGFTCPVDYGDELRAYEVETMASGHPKFGAPDGMHDDRVISLALCWWGMVNYPQSRVVDDPFAKW